MCVWVGVTVLNKGFGPANTPLFVNRSFGVHFKVRFCTKHDASDPNTLLPNTPRGHIIKQVPTRRVLFHLSQHYRITLALLFSVSVIPGLSVAGASLLPTVIGNSMASTAAFGYYVAKHMASQ